MGDAAGRYREWAVGPASPELAASLACLWARLCPPGGDAILVLPDACVDLVWDGASLLVAGPDTGPALSGPPAGGFFAGARFRPGKAPALLGLPASELLDARVPLCELWGRAATEPLEGRLCGATRPEEAARLLAGAVASRLPYAGDGDSLVEQLVAFLASAPASAGVVGAAAAGLGVGERLLHRRCCAAVGYGPKLLEEVLRFRRAERIAADGTAPLGLVAALAGYADQAHLVRQCRRLSGRVPSELFKTAQPADG